ncbi:DUF6115 domain-containing protein [Caldalkalibacillus salinus]|uniref:DUF6115 domain-containing protein n=1 Tax=Caldalkalibacillus salinus TaxID=2803787 RepID=UPI00192359B3|nr:hypothetical protein [Caldalkalibacillus salinus]
MYIIMIISLILHIATIYAVVLLFQRRSFERTPTIEQDVETIHDSIASFIDQVEQDNEALYQKLVKHIQDLEAKRLKDADAQQQMFQDHVQQLQEQKEVLEQRLEKINELWQEAQASQDTINQTEATKLEKKSSKEASEEKSPQSEDVHANLHENHEKVLSLHGAGYSVDEIAKKLKIGKGETQLLITLIERKENDKVKDK